MRWQGPFLREGGREDELNARLERKIGCDDARSGSRREEGKVAGGGAGGDLVCTVCKRLARGGWVSSVQSLQDSAVENRRTGKTTHKWRRNGAVMHGAGVPRRSSHVICPVIVPCVSARKM